MKKEFKSWTIVVRPPNSDPFIMGRHWFNRPHNPTPAHNRGCVCVLFETRREAREHAKKMKYSKGSVMRVTVTVEGYLRNERE